MSLYSQMKSELAKTAAFFSEDPSKIKIDEFFSVFATFSTDFDVSIIVHANMFDYQ